MKMTSCSEIYIKMVVIYSYLERDIDRVLKFNNSSYSEINASLQ